MVGTTALITTATQTGGNLVKATLDPIINGGTLFAYDFANLLSWDPATDVLGDGATVRNMVSGAPNGALVIPSAGNLTYVADRGFLYGATASLARVTIDTGTQYFQTNLGHDFWVWCWVTLPATDPGGYDSGYLISKMPAVINSGPGIHLSALYSSSGRISGKWSEDALNSNADTVATGSVPVSGKMMLAMAKIGSTVSLFKNGTLIATGTLTAPLTARNQPLTFGSRAFASGRTIPGIYLHRIMAEDLTVSAAVAGMTTSAMLSAQLAAEYAANSGRFG